MHSIYWLKNNSFNIGCAEGGSASIVKDALRSLAHPISITPTTALADLDDAGHKLSGKAKGFT